MCRIHSVQILKGIKVVNWLLEFQVNKINNFRYKIDKRYENLTYLNPDNLGFISYLSYNYRNSFSTSIESGQHANPYIVVGV